MIAKLWFSEVPCPLCHDQLLTENIDRGRAETDMKIRKRQSMTQYKKNKFTH